MRLVASSLAEAIGHGGIKYVADVSMVSRSTIIRGLQEMEAPAEEELEKDRQRRPGGGRKSAGVATPGVSEALEALISPYTRGDPENPLRWTPKSLRWLEDELSGMGYAVSHVTVGEMLEKAGYTL